MAPLSAPRKRAARASLTCWPDVGYLLILDKKSCRTTSFTNDVLASE